MSFTSPILDLNAAISRAESYPLTEDDIRKYMNDEVDIISYPELATMDSLEDLFTESNNVVLHIPVKSGTDGHWVCLFRDYIRGEPTITYFCPYGFSPMENIEASPYLMHEKDRNDLALVYLIKRFKGRYNGRFVHSPYVIQKLKNSVNTCGRHCIARLLHRNMNNAEYYQYITSLQETKGLSPDELVSLIMLW